MKRLRLISIFLCVCVLLSALVLYSRSRLTTYIVDEVIGFNSENTTIRHYDNVWTTLDYESAKVWVSQMTNGDYSDYPATTSEDTSIWWDNDRIGTTEILRFDQNGQANQLEIRFIHRDYTPSLGHLAQKIGEPDRVRVQTFGRSTRVIFVYSFQDYFVTFNFHTYPAKPRKCNALNLYKLSDYEIFRSDDAQKIEDLEERGIWYEAFSIDGDDLILCR